MHKEGPKDALHEVVHHCGLSQYQKNQLRTFYFSVVQAGKLHKHIAYLPHWEPPPPNTQIG